MRAASHIASTEPKNAHTSEPTTDSGDTVVSPMRIGMMIGDAHGNHDSTTASVVLGLMSTGLRKIHPLIISSMIGNTACCASCSLFTIEPAAANRSEERRVGK